MMPSLTAIVCCALLFIVLGLMWLWGCSFFERKAPAIGVFRLCFYGDTGASCSDVSWCTRVRHIRKPGRGQVVCRHGTHHVWGNDGGYARDKN